MNAIGVLTRAERTTRQAFDFEHRRFEDAQYLRISPALVADWLADVQLPAEFFKDRQVLDVGCGSGRWSYAMALLGARVVAVDFSDAAVEMTRRVTRSLPNVDVLKASLWNLPFPPAQFDFVVSWGVLHHTRNTAEAFRAVAPLVRPGGIFHMMVYERRSPVKVAGTELLRGILRRLPAETRYRFCAHLIIRNRLLFHLLRGVIACIPKEHLSDRLDAQTAQFGLYDWYSPRYNHLHRLAEVRRWFTDAGYDDLRVTTPVKYRKPLEVLRFGECGGSITVQGKRVRSQSGERGP